MELFAPPINRTMRQLNRAFFTKLIPLSAARVYDIKQMAKIRKELSREILKVPKVGPVQLDPTTANGKCLLLNPRVKHDDPSTWSARLHDLIRNEQTSLFQYDLKLNYDHWTHNDIIQAILPEDLLDEIPSGFTTAGHVAHLNLRNQYLPFKSLIGSVILDKAQQVQTVLNKVENVGEQNEYRTFKYEILAGEDNLDVTLTEQDCVFRFNFSKVYWNSRLSTEHSRLVSIFKEGQAICDVMAGIGPFAIPAGKKNCFVWANDLNPESYDALKSNIKTNKVEEFVFPSCTDGRAFIRNATRSLLTTKYQASAKQRKGRAKVRKASSKEILRIEQPQIFSHYVMNLPASALSFLSSYVGLYPQEARQLFAPNGPARLPMIHVYCFQPKFKSEEASRAEICEEISRHLKTNIVHDDTDVDIIDVRDVAPSKRMYCASFRLPEAVAFADC